MAHPTPIRTVSDVDILLEASHRGPVVIFKHSVACSLSGRARRGFQEVVEAGPDATAVVVVQQARPASDYIADVTGIRHETPQVLIIAAGTVTYHASHGRIASETVLRALAEAESSVA